MNQIDYAGAARIPQLDDLIPAETLKIYHATAE